MRMQNTLILTSLTTSSSNLPKIATSHSQKTSRQARAPTVSAAKALAQTKTVPISLLRQSYFSQISSPATLLKLTRTRYACLKHKRKHRHLRTSYLWGASQGKTRLTARHSAAVNLKAKSLIRCTNQLEKTKRRLQRSCIGRRLNWALLRKISSARALEACQLTEWLK